MQLLNISQEEEGDAGINLQHIDEMFEIRWLKCSLETLTHKNEMTEQQIEVLPEKLLEQQSEMLPEVEETQIFYNFDVCFMIAGTDGRTKECLVQEERKIDDDSDWKFKYQSRGLLKSENEEIVMDDNQEEFYCCREQEGMDDWVAARIGVIARATVRTEQVRTEQARAQQIRTQQEEAEVEVQQSRWSSIQQSKDILDREIEFMRKLMVKVSQRKVKSEKQ